MTVIEVVCAPGARDQRVEAEEQADAEDGWRVVDGIAEANGSDGRGAEFADHDDVDDGHGHPANLRECNRDGESEQSSHLSGEVYLAAAGTVGAFIENLGVGRLHSNPKNGTDFRFYPLRIDS